MIVYFNKINLTKMIDDTYIVIKFLLSKIINFIYIFSYIR